MQSGREIEADQPSRRLLVAALQKISQIRRQGPLLSETEQGVDPEGWIPWCRRRRQRRHAKPEQVAPVLLGEHLP